MPQSQYELGFKITIIFSIVLFLNSLLFAQSPYTYEKGAIKHRVSVAPVVSFFTNDAHLSTDSKAKTGFDISYKAEFFSGSNINFIVGLDYINQQFSFRGYYAKPGFTYLYDGTFPYTHQLQMQELQLPIGIKISLAQERRYDYTPYLIGGLAARYLFKSPTTISNDSSKLTVYNGKQYSLDFESKIPAYNINTCFFAGIGFQSNHHKTGGALFIEITYKYGVSRLSYFGNNNSNNLAIRNSFIAFNLGFRI